MNMEVLNRFYLPETESKELDPQDKEGTEPTDVELLKDIKVLLEEWKQERVASKESTSVELATTDDQIAIMKEQLNVQSNQLAWLQIAICIGALYLIARGFYKLIASYLW